MTFSPKTQKYLFTAYDLVNHWEEENIFTVIKNYGEEKYARRITKAIIQKREEQPIKSAKELSDLISASLRWFEKKGKTNPSRRTMQAIRMAVNSELENLRTFLSCCLEVVDNLGVISIISFQVWKTESSNICFWNGKEKDWERKNIKNLCVPQKKRSRRNPRQGITKRKIFRFIKNL